jgi:hypothetical protein
VSPSWPIVRIRDGDIVACIDRGSISRAIRVRHKGNVGNMWAICAAIVTRDMMPAIKMKIRRMDGLGVNEGVMFMNVVCNGRIISCGLNAIL